ncbi:MAG: type II toxin-antitoxin system HicB family antitoxin [Vicinamibacterales bacterium]
MDYPITLERDDNDTLLVSFPDFPEAHTFGDDEADALAHAQEALATVLEAYIKDRRQIPLPAAASTRHRVAVPALVEAKVRLYEEMRAAKVNKSELARRLHVHLPQVDRLLDVRHGSKLDQLEAAFAALGKRVHVAIVDAPRARAADTRPRRRKARQAR